MRATETNRRPSPLDPLGMVTSPQPAGERLQPVATLDFSGFDVLNAAATPVATKPLTPALTQQPGPPARTPIESPGTRQRTRRLSTFKGRRPIGQGGRDKPSSEQAIAVQQTDHHASHRIEQTAGVVEPFDDWDADDPEEFDDPTPRQPPRSAPVPSRSRFVRFSRNALGLDRPEKPRHGRLPSGGEDDPAWLAGLDQPAPQVFDDDPNARGGRRVPADAPLTGPAPTRSRLAAEKPDGVEVTAAPRGFAAVLWLWVARVAVALIFLAGVNQVFIKPFRSTPAAIVMVPMNTAASQQAAARYVSDYLSFRPGGGSAQLAALENDAVAPAGAAVAQWTGTGYLRTDTVLPGEVTSVDATHATVAVAARIHLAAPPARDAASSTAAAAAPPGADPGPIPAGWTDLGSRWIELTVPVQLSNAAVLVSSEGAVFAGEAPPVIDQPAGSQVDNTVTTATQSVATSLLTAYASSNVAYLAAPGVSLAGLHDAVSLVSLAGWSVSLPPGSTTTGFGAGLVTWQLTGTDLHITQPYAVALTNSQGRWYGAALSPNPAAQ